MFQGTVVVSSSRVEQSKKTVDYLTLEDEGAMTC
jgi:hypothetical protein